MLSCGWFLLFLCGVVLLSPVVCCHVFLCACRVVCAFDCLGVSIVVLFCWFVFCPFVLCCVVWVCFLCAFFVCSFVLVCAVFSCSVECWFALIWCVVLVAFRLLFVCLFMCFVASVEDVPRFSISAKQIMEVDEHDATVKGNCEWSMSLLPITCAQDDMSHMLTDLCKQAAVELLHPSVGRTLTNFGRFSYNRCAKCLLRFVCVRLLFAKCWLVRVCCVDLCSCVFVCLGLYVFDRCRVVFRFLCVFFPVCCSGLCLFVCVL